MNKNLKDKDEVLAYENKLESSFDFVLSEAERLYQGQGQLRKTHQRLAKRLDELGVSYALVGGYALILHGVRRFSEDIDLLVSNKGLARLHKELIGRGYVRAAREVETFGMLRPEFRLNLW